MDESREVKIRERAYHLWEKEGRPEGRDQEFWERASLMHDSESAVVESAPDGERSDEEIEVNEASEQSFPASDPPAFTAEVGAGARRSGHRR